MASHALPSGVEARIHWRARRRKALRQLRDWRTWGEFGACIAGLWLSEGIVGHLWPKVHGASYVIVRVVVGALLGGVIAALLITVAILAVSKRLHRPLDSQGENLP